uniref:Uncharacterized protein n=1 Tax=Rhizophora mucronata TaxID=61149 RepID=A0A2P2JI53_RHIMU
MESLGKLENLLLVCGCHCGLNTLVFMLGRSIE